jgi:anaerobic selenocysteine-containing dehydrogenase
MDVTRTLPVEAAGSGRWEDIAWDQAFEEIGRHIKKARDETFIATDEQGRTVNR